LGDQRSNVNSGGEHIDDNISQTGSMRSKTVRWQEGSKPNASAVAMSPIPSNPNDREVSRPNPIIVPSSAGNACDLEAQNCKNREGFDILRFLCIIVLLLCAIFLIFLMIEAVGIL
jgi:hypothetical protein